MSSARGWTSAPRTLVSIDSGRHAPTPPSGSGAAAEDARFEFGRYGYGKNNVKVLCVRRVDADRHDIREYEVDVHLRLNTRHDYVTGDNAAIVATDTQKNTVYVLAKRHGVSTPERFAMVVADHFLERYAHVDEVECSVSEYPWERMVAGDGRPHAHAFVFNSTAYRAAMVTKMRNGKAIVKCSLSGLRVLKTTKSGFTNFHRDEYRTLPDAADRIFSTVVDAEWTYAPTISDDGGFDFDRAWDVVRNVIVGKFAGDPERGVFSPSVQHTMYTMQLAILDQIPQIDTVSLGMPNKHYFEVDLTRFPSTIVDNSTPNREVYMPVDKPAGMIYAELQRKQRAKL